LLINGNGGFVGELLNKTFLLSLINLNKLIAYYFLIVLILLFFLLSVNFKSKLFLKYLNFLYKFLFAKKEMSYTNENEIINEYIPQDEIKNLIQEDLPFIKSKKQENISKLKFKLPSIDLLKSPSKNERRQSKNEVFVNTEFLEKILLDFDVEGKIKKVSHGPVVTLYEFEPAAGVKVSKIINLSEDIARNTSSESARIKCLFK
jgi:S-DNA-T family DNA segregation ATPase FtsK/SpoIIIE